MDAMACLLPSATTPAGPKSTRSLSPFTFGHEVRANVWVWLAANLAATGLTIKNGGAWW